jgi:hypothetical protein
MKTQHSAEEYITLEGEDYNLLRAAESRAREEFGRPENLELRRQHFQLLFPKTDGLPLRVIDPEGKRPCEIL